MTVHADVTEDKLKDRHY